MNSITVPSNSKCTYLSEMLSTDNKTCTLMIKIKENKFRFI